MQSACESRTRPLVSGVIRRETGLHTLTNIIFGIYKSDDLAESIKELGCGVKFNEETISIVLYEYDIAPDEQSQQMMSNKLTDWCSMGNLSVNPKKR